jgi:hypothetical protein
MRRRAHYFPVAAPTLKELLEECLQQMDLLRGALRSAETTIRKLETKRKVDAATVRRRLAAARNEAKRVAADVRDAL